MLHIFVIGVLIKSDFVNRVQNKLGFLAKAQELTEYYYEMVSYHKRMDNSIPDKAVIFIGDSMIQSLAVAAISPIAINYGIGNDTSMGVLNRLQYYSSIKRAKAVVIAIGLNDITHGRTIVDILSNYNQILSAIPESVAVIFSSIHPVNENNGMTKGYNKTIQEINSGIQAMCSDIPRARYLDISSLLLDPSGNLSFDYDAGDGVHLNTAGYAIWIEALRNKIDRLDEKK